MQNKHQALRSDTGQAAGKRSIASEVIDVYRRRRARVIAAMAREGGGIAILPTAAVQSRSRDSDYPYRPNSYFYYLTGFTEPQAWLVLLAKPQAAPMSLLFCRAKHPEREIWEGLHFGPDAARQTFGFDAAYAIDEMPSRLPELLDRAPALYYPFDAGADFEAPLHRTLDVVRKKARRGARPPAVAYDLNALLDEMRLIKETSELDAMRTAARISAHAHRRAMQACRPGMREYALEAELLYEFRRHGAQAPAYVPIVAANANACVLHYPAGDACVSDGGLVLIDAACEYEGYAADITRTFPANGRFSAAQRALYQIVLAAQTAAIAATRAGVPFDAPHQAAVRVLAQGLLDLGLIDAKRHGGLDDVIEKQAYKRFYMHQTSHWLGMDVHDCGDYYAKETPADGALTVRTLVPHMALTIEPGLYVRAAADIPERYWDIGIRIEDDAIVTPQACELISRDVPVSIEDIEALMRDNCHHSE